MDDKLYNKKLEEKHLAEEAKCIRCGECCGASTDPCQNLSKDAFGHYFCVAYDSRLGPQKTISGKVFNCVEIKDVLRKAKPYPGCGYVK